MQEEVWKDITGYEGLYQVSNLGNVKSLNYNRTGQEKILKAINHKCGYLRVTLYKNSKCVTYRLHRLVAQAFIPNPDNLPEVNHKDEDKSNNCVNNLEWCDSKYNINYGTGITRSKEKRSKAVLGYHKKDNYIVEYPSIHEAARALGIKSSNICNCCNGKIKSYKGFVWRYVEHEEKQEA